MEKATVIYNPVFRDNRGIFAPLPLKFDNMMPNILNKDWLQSNISYNPEKWTFRGMHYQSRPYEQTKLVKVIKGKIIDFYFDMRPLSMDYGRCGFEVINEGYEILVPRGYAHGFITLEENTIVQYLVDNEYNVDSEGSILWSSIPTIVDTLIKEIKGFQPKFIVVSEKDKKAQRMIEWLNKNVTKDKNENK